MNGLTLKKLRRAINVVKKPRFGNTKGLSVQRRVDFHVEELRQAEAFLLGETDEMPRDPREVLTFFGYKW